MKTEAAGKKMIKAANNAVNYAVLTIIILLIAFAGYALWDSKQIHGAACSTNYTVYKPTAVTAGKTFQELQDLNPEVIAWLTVYGTNIDYPVAQADNNMKYVNTNAEGKYSLSGAIFLDSGNSRDFSDFNSIVYGHHMANKVMFGEIGEFADKNIFDSQQYGNLYYGGKDYGIEFFSFVHTDAYDSLVYRPNVSEDRWQAYLDNIFEEAMYTRDIGVTTEDRIILLNTCSSISTNGRDILIGRITDEVFEDTTGNKQAGNADSPHGHVHDITIWLLLILILIGCLIVILIIVYNKHRQNKSNKKLSKSIKKRGEVNG